MKTVRRLAGPCSRMVTKPPRGRSSASRPTVLHFCMSSRARSCPALLPLGRDRAAQDDAERRRGQARGQAGGDVADSGAGVAAGGQLVDTDGDRAEGGQPAAEARAEQRAYVSGRWEDLEDQDEQQREDERTGGVDEEDRPRERPRRGSQGQPDQVAGQAAEEATAGDRGDGKPVDAGPAAAAARGERSGRRCGPVASVLGGVEIRVEGQVPVVHVVGYPVLFGGWVTHGLALLCSGLGVWALVRSKRLARAWARASSCSAWTRTTAR